MREHRLSAAVWVVAGGAAMYLMGRAVAYEMSRFPGGPKALEASVMPAAQAMRPFRWPAERLDTLGGYLTYHNVTLFALFLAIYAAVLGARAIRSSEEKHTLEEILATGHSRLAVIRDRAVGFFVVLALISLGLGLGVAAAMAGGGEPDLTGSLITMGAVGLCAAAAFSLGALVSQITRSSRAAAGLASLVLTVLYVATNVWEELGVLGVVRFLSPFYYANFSRALVPGYGFHVPSAAALAVMTCVYLGLAAWAFARRDCGAPLWVRRGAGGRRASRLGGVQRRLLGSVWTAILLRGWLGLLVWPVAAGAFTALMMALEPAVMDMWSVFGAFIPGGAGISPQALYTAFSGEIIAAIIAAYVIAQASGWVTDLAQGRVEAILASPVSWTRLVWERLLALLAGVGVITAGAVAGLVIAGGAVGVDFDIAGLLRLVADCLLLGAALGALAAIVVAALRSSLAVIVLAVFVGASFLLSYLVPMFAWPEWVDRFSIFSAFGRPYLEWPAWSGMVVLFTLAVPGWLLAAAIAERTPKVA